jgi:hypothetical protein
VVVVGAGVAVVQKGQRHPCRETRLEAAVEAAVAVLGLVLWGFPR